MKLYRGDVTIKAPAWPKERDTLVVPARNKKEALKKMKAIIRKKKASYFVEVKPENVE